MTKARTQIVIRGGVAQWVDSPAATRWLAPALGEADSRRATWVEPSRPVLRLAFLAIRKLVARRSRLAAWTRRWPCRWRARILSTGAVYGPYATRQDAVRAEVAVLLKALTTPDDAALWAEEVRRARAAVHRALVAELAAYAALLAMVLAACGMW